MKYEPGAYYGQLLGAQCGKLPSAKQTPFVGISFQISHMAGQDGAWNPVAESNQREVKLFLSDGAWPYTKQKLDSLGFNGDFANPVFTETAATLTCKLNDKGYDEFDLYHEGGGSEYEPLDTNAVRTFTARYRSETQTATPPVGKPPVAPANQPAPQPETRVDPITGEDIPF